MKIINCTPHDVNVLAFGESQTFPKCEVPPRLTQKTERVDVIMGIVISETSFGEVKDLPKETEGIKLIVSRMVLAACPTRTDLLVPNELIRDENGQIRGCKSLAKN